MNAPNRPQLGDMRTMPIGEIAALPAAVLALLQEEAEEAAKAARSLADWLNGAIALRYGDRAAAARRAEGKDTGTVRFEDDEVTVDRRPAEAGRVGPGPARRDGRSASAPAARTRPNTSRSAFRVPERKYAAWPRRSATPSSRPAP